MQEEKEKLRKLNRLRLLVVLMVWLCLWLAQSLQSTRPSLLIIPFTVVQIISFALIALTSQNLILHFTIATFLLVGFAMLPTLTKRPQAHWVGE